MHPNKNQQQNEDDISRIVRPIRRGPSRGHNPRLPEPENVLTPPSNEGAQFR